MASSFATSRRYLRRCDIRARWAHCCTLSPSMPPSLRALTTGGFQTAPPIAPPLSVCIPRHRHRHGLRLELRCIRPKAPFRAAAPHPHRSASQCRPDIINASPTKQSESPCPEPRALNILQSAITCHLSINSATSLTLFHLSRLARAGILPTSGDFTGFETGWKSCAAAVAATFPVRQAVAHFSLFPSQTFFLHQSCKTIA